MSVQPHEGWWARQSERLKGAARLPLQVWVIFMASLFAWLAGWAGWRLAEWVYQTHLAESWV